MLMGNHLVGVLNVNLIRHEQPLSEAQVKGLSILSSMAASAIENARLFTAAQEEIETRKQRERELETLSKVSAALHSLISRSEMLPVILEEVSSVLKTSGAAVVLGKDTGDEVMVEVANGIWKKRKGERSTRSVGLVGQAITTKQTFVSTEEEPAPARRRSKQKGEEKIIACTPLIVQDDVIGALLITRREVFSDTELTLLKAIGDIAASSLQRSRLFEQTQERLNRLTGLRTIDLAITSSLDLRVTLNILLEEVANQLGLDVAGVLLTDPHTQTLEYASGRGFRTKALEEVRISPGTGFAGAAVLERRMTLIREAPNMALDSLAKSLFSEEGLEFSAAIPLISKGEVEGVLIVGKRSSFNPTDEWLEYLNALAGQAAIAIDSARLFDNLGRANQQLTLAYNATIEGWSRALDLRDKETEGHTQRVTEMTLRLARAMDLFDEEDLIHIRRGALLHDIGKMVVPDHILLKAGPLTDEEWDLMKQHPEYAYHLIYPIPYLRKALDIPYSHHERWDGSGYPRGLRGEQIPLAARVFAAVDVWDALSSVRPYRPSWPVERVMDYLKENAGTHFDPQVVADFIRLLKGSHSAAGHHEGR
jgi:HD-GYP domain-containing protein (c-di-GMP phosphodiesterase class II)